MIVRVGGGVSGLRRLEGGNAVGDRLDPGQGGAARSERAQDQHGRDPADLARVAHAVVGALGDETVAERDARGTHGQHHEHADHEAVRRDGERPARLLDPAQVDEREHADEAEREGDRVGSQRRDRAGDRCDAGNDRHGDGEHVIDQQGSRGRQRRVLAEVGPTDRVGAAAVRVGGAGLAIGRDHDHQQDDDPQSDPRGQAQHREAAEPEHQQDLLGGVGDR